MHIPSMATGGTLTGTRGAFLCVIRGGGGGVVGHCKLLLLAGFHFGLQPGSGLDSLEAQLFLLCLHMSFLDPQSLDLMG